MDSLDYQVYIILKVNYNYCRKYTEIEYVANDPASKAEEGLVEELQPKVKLIQDLYPMRLSEAEPKKN